MPLEAFSTSKEDTEAFGHSGKEARGTSPKLLPLLIVIAGIDESSQLTIDVFDQAVARLREIEVEALDRGVVLAFQVWDYRIKASDSHLEDTIVPFGRSMPNLDFISKIAGARDTNTGRVADTSSLWRRRVIGIAESTEGGLSASGSRVSFILDSSGSMGGSDWHTLPGSVDFLFTSVFRSLEVDLRFSPSELWPNWFIDAWDAYLVDHPELP